MTVNSVTSWTELDHGDGATIAAALFDHIRFRPVTWSGLAAEVPLLTLTAMALLGWLRGIGIDARMAHLASWFLRSRPCSERIAVNLAEAA